MTDWMNPDEAMSYFGVDLETLEALVLEYNMEADVDDAGELIAINAADIREPLFNEHEKQVGHRPDDFRAHDKAVKEIEQKEEKEKKEREDRRSNLVHRVSMRG